MAAGRPPGAESRIAAQPNTTDASARGEVRSRAAGSARSKSAAAVSTNLAIG